jgi:hypothetical protein
MNDVGSRQFGTEAAAITLLYESVAFGQISSCAASPYGPRTIGGLS